MEDWRLTSPCRPCPVNGALGPRRQGPRHPWPLQAASFCSTYPLSNYGMEGMLLVLWQLEDVTIWRLNVMVGLRLLSDIENECRRGLGGSQAMFAQITPSFLPLLWTRCAFLPSEYSTDWVRLPSVFVQIFSVSSWLLLFLQTGCAILPCSHRMVSSGHTTG